MELNKKKLLFILGVILLIGLPIYYFLPRLTVLVMSTQYLVMLLVGIVILIKLLGNLWRRL